MKGARSQPPSDSAEVLNESCPRLSQVVLGNQVNEHDVALIPVALIKTRLCDFSEDTSSILLCQWLLTPPGLMLTKLSNLWLA